MSTYPELSAVSSSLRSIADDLDVHGVSDIRLTYDALRILKVARFAILLARQAEVERDNG